MEKFAKIYLSIAVISVVCGSLFLQISALQKSIIDEQNYQRILSDAKQVKITAITWGGSPTGYIGSSMRVRVSVKNFGTNDV